MDKSSKNSGRKKIDCTNYICESVVGIKSHRKNRIARNRILKNILQKEAFYGSLQFQKAFLGIFFVLNGALDRLLKTGLRKVGWDKFRP